MTKHKQMPYWDRVRLWKLSYESMRSSVDEDLYYKLRSRITWKLPRTRLFRECVEDEVGNK